MAVLVDREQIAAPAEAEALGLLGLAALVVVVLRARAALAAVVARVAPASMRVDSAMAPLVVMPERVAKVEQAELREHRALTPRPCSAALAGAAVTPVLRALARRVSAA